MRLVLGERGVGSGVAETARLQTPQRVRWTVHLSRT